MSSSAGPLEFFEFSVPLSFSGTATEGTGTDDDYIIGTPGPLVFSGDDISTEVTFEIEHDLRTEPDETATPVRAHVHRCLHPGAQPVQRAGSAGPRYLRLGAIPLLRLLGGL